MAYKILSGVPGLPPGGNGLPFGGYGNSLSGGPDGEGRSVDQAGPWGRERR